MLIFRFRFFSTYAQRYMISFHDKNCKDGSTNHNSFCRTKEPMNERSQWMALPILLQQVLVRFYDTTNVQKWIMVWWYMIIAYTIMMQKVLMCSFILQKLLRFVLPSLQQKYIFQNILLFTFLSTLCAETYSNCNSVQMFINLGFDFWQKRKIELFNL